MQVTRKWYFEVNDYCKTLSEYYNVPLIKVAGILSALSPNNTFRSNIKSLERFLRTSGNCKVTTFGNQKKKAQRILDASEAITESEVKEILGKGLKTRSFFENILRPDTSEAVTVDLWQIRWAKSLGLMPENGTLTDKRYRDISNAVKEYSKEFGMLPHEFQAGTWTTIRGASF